MVFFDLFIELYTAHADFWYWQNDQILIAHTPIFHFILI